MSYCQSKQRGKTGTHGGSSVVGFAENPEKNQNAWAGVDRPLREQENGEERCSGKSVRCCKRVEHTMVQDLEHSSFLQENSAKNKHRICVNGFVNASPSFQ